MIEYQGIMVDIETIDNTNSSAVISAGFVKFNLADEDNYDTLEDDSRCLEVIFNVHEQLDMGRTASWDTIKWWMDQSVMAKQVFKRKPVLDNYDALKNIKKWAAPTKEHFKNVRMWGNGATFDNVIMRSLYATYEIPFPTAFWGDMCYRTLKSLAPDIPEIERGVHHDALDDAKFQVIMAQQYYQALCNGEQT